MAKIIFYVILTMFCLPSFACAVDVGCKWTVAHTGAQLADGTGYAGVYSCSGITSSAPNVYSSSVYTSTVLNYECGANGWFHVSTYNGAFSVDIKTGNINITSDSDTNIANDIANHLPACEDEYLPEMICNDLIDNDQDGFVDCADSDCLGSPDCGNCDDSDVDGIASQYDPWPSDNQSFTWIQDGPYPSDPVPDLNILWTFFRADGAKTYMTNGVESPPGARLHISVGGNPKTRADYIAIYGCGYVDQQSPPPALSSDVESVDGLNPIVPQITGLPVIPDDNTVLKDNIDNVIEGDYLSDIVDNTKGTGERLDDLFINQQHTNDLIKDQIVATADGTNLLNRQLQSLNNKEDYGNQLLGVSNEKLTGIKGAIDLTNQNWADKLVKDQADEDLALSVFGNAVDSSDSSLFDSLAGLVSSVSSDSESRINSITDIITPFGDDLKYKTELVDTNPLVNTYGDNLIRSLIPLDVNTQGDWVFWVGSVLPGQAPITLSVSNDKLALIRQFLAYGFFVLTCLTCWTILVTGFTPQN